MFVFTQEENAAFGRVVEAFLNKEGAGQRLARAAKMAAEFEVTPPTVSLWALGHNCPSVLRVRRAVEAYCAS
ncbi:MAG: hypothetical protein WAX89_04175 [Alphaproteobacteria bacterium]